MSRARLVNYMRPMLWNLWTADGKAMLWWCAFDQTNLAFAPYDWKEPCLELGIMKGDRTPYPAAEPLKRFAAFQEKLGFAIPKAKADAVVCLGLVREKMKRVGKRESHARAEWKCDIIPSGKRQE